MGIPNASPPPQFRSSQLCLPSGRLSLLLLLPKSFNASTTSSPTSAFPNLPYLKSLNPPTVPLTLSNNSSASRSNASISLSISSAAASSAGMTVRGVWCFLSVGRFDVAPNNFLIFSTYPCYIAPWGRNVAYLLLNQNLLIHLPLSPVFRLYTSPLPNYRPPLRLSSLHLFLNISSNLVSQQRALVNEMAVQALNFGRWGGGGEEQGECVKG